MNADQIRLTQIRPVDGKPNPYRTRWYEHDGVVFEVESSHLHGIWRVSTDTDLLGVLIERHQFGRELDREAWRLAFYGRPEGELLRYVRSDLCPLAHAMRLPDARAVIAEWINSPQWPAIRVAYRALRADLDGKPALHYPQDRVWRWCFTGGHDEYTPQPLTVVRVNRVTYTVRTDQGSEFRIPHHKIEGLWTES